jgi:5'-nucleotidase
MRILIVNDDGMEAAQLPNLIRWARTIGEVTTFVPKVEQSGKSHSFEIKRDFEAKQVQLTEDITIWAVDSTPADCVRFAVLGLNLEFDLVISGVNRGLNVGADIMYSGTVSAVMEAANLGLKAIALSTTPDNYSKATEELDKVFAFVAEHKLLDLSDIWNINIPASPKAIRITRQGGPYYSDNFQPQENDMFLPLGVDVFTPADNYDRDTDTVLRGGMISVMPLTTDRTNLAIYDYLRERND